MQLQRQRLRERKINNAKPRKLKEIKISCAKLDNEIFLVYSGLCTGGVSAMQINKAIRKVMKDKGVTLLSMARAIGKEKGNDVSSRLNSPNMTFNNVVEMLDVLGYEVVVQERKPGSRRSDQIVIDQRDSGVVQ